MPTRELLERLATWVGRVHRPERGAVGWLVIGVIIGMILVVVLIIQLIIPGDGD
jgi:tetrahydromethanopterin S-methyltransferase subunit F